jgi:sulfide:quinone oxidoreductase
MSSDRTSVLIAGGGVAALEAALALRALAPGRVDVELLAPEPYFWYRPLAVAEPFGLGEARHFDLGDLASAAGAGLTLGALRGVDPRRRVARTVAGATMGYDVLLLAHGALPTPSVPGALTFRGPADAEALGALLAEIDAGAVRRVAFVVPWGAGWSLPAYELALLTAARDVEVALVTPEDEPLELFGQASSAVVREELEGRGIELRTGAYALDVRDGELRLARDDALAVDRVVALPRLRGRRIDGIPATADGFVPVDEHCRVPGVPGVLAAGDATSFPVKQGGIAAQQADAAAEAIAALAGVELEPRPFRAALRGLLLTGGAPRYLSGSEASAEPLWWPPAKIVARHLAPFLAEVAGADVPVEPPTAPPRAVRVDVHLGAGELAAVRPARLERAVDAGRRGGRTVGGVMSREPLVAEPMDTLGETAERMRERDVGSALVCDAGRLVGILTSRDLLRAFAARVHPSEGRVREWMTAEPVSVGAASSVDAAALLMADYGVHHLPVVEGARPVGVVAMQDLVRATAPSSPVRVGLGF